MTLEDSGAPHEESMLLPSADERSLRDRLPTFTYRSISVGLVIGVVGCLSNVYFGLQNGFGDTMAMASSLLGFALFRPFKSTLRTPFGPKENVLIQTTASAIASMPLAAGLVSVIVALENIIEPSEGGPLHFRWLDLTIWALGLSFSGAFLAMLLRKHTLEEENMPFPSATASAIIIKALHNEKPSTISVATPEVQPFLSDLELDNGSDGVAEDPQQLPLNSVRDISIALLVSSLITVLESFWPGLHNIPFLGNYLAQKWLWTFNLSTGIFGQGIITGPIIPFHMLVGTIVCWGILSPVAKKNGWAPGEVDDWTSGSRGWTLWIALSILLTDCLVNIIWMIFTIRAVSDRVCSVGIWLRKTYAGYAHYGTSDDQSQNGENYGASSTAHLAAETQHLDSDVPIKNNQGSWKRSYYTFSSAILASAILCVGTTKFAFGEQVPIGAILLAVIISLFLGLISIRAMAQTDHSPVSGLGKLSQFVFALIISKSNPKRFIINLAVGAIGEAGAVQATVLMFDLKTGSLLGADPFAQMSAHMIGSLFGAFISAGFYKLYTIAYAVPGPLFQAPTAHIWVAAARLAYGAGLPAYSFEFSIVFAVIAAITTTLKIRYHGCWWNHCIPSGVAFAIGMYNAPAFTLPRVLGGITYWVCNSRMGMSPTTLRLISAGLVLGESIFSLTGLLIPK